MSEPGFGSIALALLLLAGEYGAHRADAPETLHVPGGAEAIGHFLGYEPDDLQEFVPALGAILLRTVRTDHDGPRVPDRAALAVYLETVDSIRRRFAGGEIRLDGRAALERDFVELGQLLGFAVGLSSAGPVLGPGVEQHAPLRRRVARALGWDLSAIGERLMRGEAVRLRCADERVRASGSLPPSRWAELSGRSVTSRTALRELVDDQRLGLILAGLARVDSLTREFLDQTNQLSWLYREAALPFYRYAAALRIHERSFEAPGGEASHAIWRQLLGVGPDRPEAFLRALLADRQSRAAYLWSTLYFCPPGLRDYLIGLKDRQGKPALLALHRALGAIDPLAALDDAHGRALALPALLRRLRLNEAGDALDLPGGAALWLNALEGSRAAVDQDLERAARRFRRKPIGDAQFLARALTSRVDSGPFTRPMLSRVIRTIGVFDGNGQPLTTDNVVLLNHAADNYPMALVSLQRLQIRDPTAIRDYAVVLSQMESMPFSPEKFLYIANFQGGVELLRVLAESRRLAREQVETRFAEWAAIHRKRRHPFQAVRQQLAWVSRVMQALPPDDDGPGRAPYERALLARVVARDDPQTFRWRGLNYTGHRGHDLRESLAHHLERQEIPTIDRLLEIDRELTRLRAAYQDEERIGAAEISRGVARSLGELPPGPLRPGLPNERLRRWFEPVDREAARAIVGGWDSGAVEDLPARLREIERVRQSLSHDLRSFFLGVAYLEGMMGLRSMLVDQTSLIRRHAMIKHFDTTAATLGDSAWVPARALLGSSARPGRLLYGHLGSVTPALAEFHFPQLGLDTPVSLSEHLGVWFADLTSTPWPQISPQISGATHRLIRAGTDVLERAADERAADEGLALRLVAEQVPPARFERYLAGASWLVAPSERFALGLAALRSRPDVLSAQRRSEPDFGAVVEQELAVVGAPTPHLKGGWRRWVGRWPPYESVDREGVVAALIERELVDLRLSVIDYLGGRGLPGELGADLMRFALEDLAAGLRLHSRLDWESVLRAVDSMDHDFFDEKMRRCLEQDFYRPRGS